MSYYMTDEEMIAKGICTWCGGCGCQFCDGTGDYPHATMDGKQRISNVIDIEEELEMEVEEELKLLLDGVIAMAKRLDLRVTAMRYLSERLNNGEFFIVDNDEYRRDAMYRDFIDKDLASYRKKVEEEEERINRGDLPF
jgi:hypothetical protein